MSKTAMTSFNLYAPQSLILRVKIAAVRNNIKPTTLIIEGIKLALEKYENKEV